MDRCGDGQEDKSAFLPWEKAQTQPLRDGGENGIFAPAEFKTFLSSKNASDNTTYTIRKTPVIYYHTRHTSVDSICQKTPPSDLKTTELALPPHKTVAGTKSEAAPALAPLRPRFQRANAAARREGQPRPYHRALGHKHPTEPAKAQTPKPKAKQPLHPWKLRGAHAALCLLIYCTVLDAILQDSQEMPDPTQNRPAALPNTPQNPQTFQQNPGRYKTRTSRDAPMSWPQSTELHPTTCTTDTQRATTAGSAQRPGRTQLWTTRTTQTAALLPLTHIQPAVPEADPRQSANTTHITLHSGRPQTLPDTATRNEPSHTEEMTLARPAIGAPGEGPPYPNTHYREQQRRTWE